MHCSTYIIGWCLNRPDVEEEFVHIHFRGKFEYRDGIHNASELIKLSWENQGSFFHDYSARHNLFFNLITGEMWWGTFPVPHMHTTWVYVVPLKEWYFLSPVRQYLQYMIGSGNRNFLYRKMEHILVIDNPATSTTLANL